MFRNLVGSVKANFFHAPRMSFMRVCVFAYMCVITSLLLFASVEYYFE